MAKTDLARRYRKIAEETLRIEEEEARRQDDEVTSRPSAPASEEAVARAEKRRGRQFHPAYRAFLRTFDGWHHFAWGLSLYGTKELAGETYEEDWEVFTYGDDPLPEELAGALLIGASENDASRVLLLRGGHVVEWMYEEERRHRDLAAFLATRKTVLLEMREAALATVRVTEREWDPEVRAAEDRALEAELRRALRSRVDAARSAPPRARRPLPRPVAPGALVLKKGKEVVARVDLGLVLYLGAAPTKEEVLATWRAFRRRFPARGKLEWRLASAMEFFNEEADDPDSEPFAGKLKIDDQGHFGLRAQIEPTKRGARGTWIINIRGVPPEELDDEDGEDGRQGDGAPASVPRASFVEVLVPPDEDPGALEALCHDLVDFLPVRSGHAGWFALVFDDDVEPDPYATVLAWCRRFFGVEVTYIDGWLGAARRRHRGAGWLTVLGAPFARALGRMKLSAAVARHEGKRAVVLRAGPTPPLGDVARGEFPEAIAEVARAIEPVTITGYAKHGTMSMGGVWFTTSTDELPGAFADHHATMAHLRRFVDPAGLVGPTPREQAEALLEKLCARTKQSTFKEWTKAKRAGDDGFGDLLRSLYNATTAVTTTPLAIEALELAARYPGWAPPQVYNNLLYAYLHTKETAKAMAIMDVALRTATDNVHTYHNAACMFVRAGKLDRALECARLAKEGGYSELERMRVDEDLAPLAKKKAFQALFVEKNAPSRKSKRR